MKYFLKGRERGTGYAEACTWNRVQATSNQPKIENFTLKITAARDYFPESEVVLSKNCLYDIQNPKTPVNQARLLSTRLETLMT